MEAPKNVLDLLQLDTQMDDIKMSTDIYSQTKEILDRTNVALGRKIEYSVITTTSANIYNISSDEQLSTH